MQTHHVFGCVGKKRTGREWKEDEAPFDENPAMLRSRLLRVESAEQSSAAAGNNEFAIAVETILESAALQIGGYQEKKPCRRSDQKRGGGQGQQDNILGANTMCVSDYHVSGANPHVRSHQP